MKLRRRVEEEFETLIFINKMQEGEIDEIEALVKKLIKEAIEEDRKNVVEYAKVEWIDIDEADVDVDSIINAPQIKF